MVGLIFSHIQYEVFEYIIGFSNINIQNSMILFANHETSS